MQSIDASVSVQHAVFTGSFRTSGTVGLVFLGGLGGIADVWAAQAAGLGDRFPCVTYDLRGYGRSDKPLPAVRYGVERHVRDVATIMDTAGVNRVILVGHLLGGNNAIGFTLDYPERITALVLVGTFAAGAQLVEAAGEFDVVSFVKESIAYKQSRFEFFQSSGATEAVSLETTKWPTYALLGNLETFLAFDAREELDRLRLPVLVVHADDEQVSPLDPCGRYLAEHIPDAHLEVFKGGTHCPMIQQPERFNEVLRRFTVTALSWPEQGGRAPKTR